MIFAMFNQVQDRYSDPEPQKTFSVDNKTFELYVHNKGTYVG